MKERLRILREQEIDAAIAEISNDADYQQDAIRMAREFERSDWDAFRTECETSGRTTNEKASTAKAGHLSIRERSILSRSNKSN